jgi:hypothetical protein
MLGSGSGRFGKSDPDKNHPDPPSGRYDLSQCVTPRNTQKQFPLFSETAETVYALLRQRF